MAWKKTLSEEKFDAFMLDTLLIAWMYFMLGSFMNFTMDKTCKTALLIAVENR